MRIGQIVCLLVRRNCRDCNLNLGLCKAVERSKVTAARKIKEETLKVEEDAVEKTEIIKEEEVTYAVPVNEEPV